MSPSLSDAELIQTKIIQRDLIGGHGHPYLNVHDSDVSTEFGTYFVLLTSKAVIGRDSTCAVRLETETVSARHAMITLDMEGANPRAHLEHLSRNQKQTTVVEGPNGLYTLKPHEKAILQPGEKVHLGRATIRFDVYDLCSRLRQPLEHAVALMRQGQYQKAINGLATAGRYRVIGGDGSTELERTLVTARYYEARI